MDLTLDFFDTYSTTSESSAIRSRRKSSVVPGISIHSAIYATTSTSLQDTLISFLSYIKTQNIPILPVTKPDIRTVLGQGASFLVNGVELPWTYTDPVAGTIFPRGMVVAYKRAVLNKDMSDPIADRIRVLFNELFTTCHPPLRSHPNIVKLHGVAFENEGPADAINAMPVLVPEVAELGNLAEVLETARKEDRPLAFEDKISLCIDIAHGLEILHACDIVHGDVKCENVLIFEKDDQHDQQTRKGFNLCCKLTDFGVSRHPNGGVTLGGSRPWQAPECSRGAYFKIEAAKRTDVYSFGMLLWRVMFDGDPFKFLGQFEGATEKDRRMKRNEAVAALKHGDHLVHHVCESLAISEKFSRIQIEMLSEVMNITLIQDPSRRELDFGRIIRLLTPNNWYESRHVRPPQRLPLDVDAQLLDLEKEFSEFEKASPVVQKHIAEGYRDIAQDLFSKEDMAFDEKAIAAAFQLAMCYANGFGVPFDRSECFKWCRIAAERGSQKALDALPKVAQAFDFESKEFVNVWSTPDDSFSMLSISGASDVSTEDYLRVDDRSRPAAAKLKPDEPGPASSWTLLKAAERSQYEVLDSMLLNGAKSTVSQDGVSPLHFFSSWSLHVAEILGCRMIEAGADINARAQRGSTVGGTPLVWAVYSGHIAHSRILLKLGADPMAMQDGDDALSFAARTHSAAHLRLLLENLRPAQVRGHIQRLVEAAAGGESRFKRITRHGENWKIAAKETLLLLQSWNSLFPDAVDFRDLMLSALHASLISAYGRMNSDVQISFIRETLIQPSQMTELLRESVESFNVDLYQGLLEYGVPINGVFSKGKTLLHFCAKIPDHNLAATAFTPPLLALGAEIDKADDDGITPWMDAILERKWDLADLLLEKGADPLRTNKQGFNVLGLCITSINLGALKYLVKYCAAKNRFLHESFIVNAERKISALQLAATLPLPRAHGMKIEVMGVFLNTLANFAREEWQMNFRSDAFLPNATALEIAASKGHLNHVKNLVKNGAHLHAGDRAIDFARTSLTKATDPMKRKSLERCVFLLEHWDADEVETRKLADDWTNMRTIDESNVNSSWEIVVFDYKSRKALAKKK